MNNVGHNGVSTKCCYCGRIKSDGHWTQRVEPAETLFSHGCCPLCEEQMMAELGFMEDFPPMPLPSEASGLRTGHVRRAHRTGVADAIV